MINHKPFTRFEVFETIDYVYLIGARLVADLNKIEIEQVKYDNSEFIFTKETNFKSSQNQRRRILDSYEPVSWKLIRFDRDLKKKNEEKSFIFEDPQEYSTDEINNILYHLIDSFHSHGGLRRIANGVAIVGLVRFTYGYYLILICERILVGILENRSCLWY